LFISEVIEQEGTLSCSTQCRKVARYLCTKQVYTNHDHLWKQSK